MTLEEYVGTLRFPIREEILALILRARIEKREIISSSHTREDHSVNIGRMPGESPVYDQKTIYFDGQSVEIKEQKNSVVWGNSLTHPH